MANERIGDAEDWDRLSFIFDAAAACLSQEKFTTQADAQALAQRYAEIGEAYLTNCYNPVLLGDESAVGRLPGMHRFVWYFLRALEQLDAGQPVEYVRQLRTALKQAPAMKHAVKFLADRVGKEDKESSVVTPELLSMAAQVRMLLSAYPADHPAVQQIKMSPAYQQVSHLIEGREIKWNS